MSELSEIEYKNEWINNLQDTVNNYLKIINKRDKEIQLLEKACDFYADRKNWYEQEHCYSDTSTRADDWFDSYDTQTSIGGKLARETKEELLKLRSDN